MDLITLKETTEKLATSRGHEMAWLTPCHGEYRTIQNAICLHCGKELQIVSRLAGEPNIPAISVVDAIQENCQEEEKEQCAAPTVSSPFNWGSNENSRT